MDLVIENWQAITAGALIFIATIDKVGLVALKTIKNLMDAWNDTFLKGSD
jgi:hypothetical protein